MKKIIHLPGHLLLCICFLLLPFTPTISLAASTISATAFLTKKPAPPNASILNAAYFTLDTARLALSLRNSGHLRIENLSLIMGKRITLILKPARSVFDPKTICIVTSPSGDIQMPVPELIVYRGTILGQPNSRVVLTYSGCGLICSIHDEDGNVYVLGQLRTSKDMTEYILCKEHALLSTSDFTPFNCMNDGKLDQLALRPIDDILADVRHSSNGKAGINAVNTSTLLETEIAVEADNDFYKAAGNDPAKVLGYIGAMFAMSSSIFEDEAHLTFRIPWVKAWATADPYQVKGNAYALPDTVKSYWQSHYQNVQRDLAHVMTSVSYGGGGFGWFSLCDNNQSYSVSSPQTGHKYPTFAFTYDAYIVSHEIGHNFGLPHSHDCYWNPPLDTCYTKDDPNTALRLGDACYSLPITARKNPGTIMSYCANSNYVISGNNFAEYKLGMTFSHRVDTVLRANAEKALCITSPADPTIILTAPRGSVTYKGDSTIAIEWAYANVQNVLLSYSDDGGATWTSIKDNVSAALGSYDWKLPAISSTKMLVRIVDAAPPSKAADTSLLFFTVTSAPKPEYSNLALSGVIAGKINANTPTQFTWSSSGPVGVGTIQMSTDHTTWNDILSVTEGASSKAWTTPDADVPTAYFKITNKNSAENEMTNPIWIFKQTGSVKNMGGTPTTFTMTPNFPNPVSSTTTITFAVPKLSQVLLTIRNDLGKTVATVVNEKLAAGSYDAAFNAADLPSGYYNYVLESGTIKLLGKMQVVK